jgi:MYXO-CTERM domain-containing protein
MDAGPRPDVALPDVSVAPDVEEPPPDVTVMDAGVDADRLLVDDSVGCGCRATGGARGGPWALVAVALVAGLRRRRR